MSTTSPRVRFLPMHPFPVAFGGLEAQCLGTSRALAEAGIPARLLDPYDLADDFDILHLFGPSLGAVEIVREMGDTRPIVISALFGGARPSVAREAVVSSVSAGAGLARQRTTHALMRAVLHGARQVICVNRAEAEFAGRRYGLPGRRLSVVPNGVSDAFYDASPDLFAERYAVEDFVLFVGNIIPRKNPLSLARALVSLNRSGVFIGSVLRTSEAYGREFESVVSSSDRLVWLPGVPPDDPILPSAYAAARLLCLPSSSETQPVAALEAMAAGTPILLGDRPYARMAPFGGAAYRCDPDDERAIGRAVQEALERGDRGPGLPERHRWRNIAERIARIYAEHCSDATTRGKP